MEPKVRSWSSLTIDLLHIIFEKLDCDDISRSAAVCVSWESAIIDLYHQLSPIAPPLLLISNVGVFKDESGIVHRDKWSSHQSCIIFSARTHKIHEIVLPELEGRWFSSSSNGWLLTVSFDATNNMYLLNPFTRARIELPSPEREFSEPQNLRVITPISPLDGNYIIFGTDGYKSAFCRPGDWTWKAVAGFYGFCSDAIFFDEAIYAVDGYGDIFRMCFGFYARAEKLPIRHVKLGFCNYLVKLEGNLLLVLRFGYGKQDHESSQTYTRFEVYCLDRVGKQWIVVKNIGNKAILLGKYNSIAIDARGTGDLNANCIYFIDDARGKGTIMSEVPEHDTGVYDMETGSIEWLYQSSPIWSSPLNWLTVGRQL